MGSDLREFAADTVKLTNKAIRMTSRSRADELNRTAIWLAFGAF
jgi:hypothetical protein